MSGIPDIPAKPRKSYEGNERMFELGDTVRVVSSGETRKIVGTGPGEFFSTQIGDDGSTVKLFKGSDLVLVKKASRSDDGPTFVAPNPFTT